MDFNLIKKLILLPLGVTSLVALIITPLTIFFYRSRGWIEDPRKKTRPQDTHSSPVPRGGGIPIFLSVLASALLFLPLDQHLKGILAGTTLIAMIGFLDDLFDLNPYLRLIACFLASWLVVLSGIGISFITNPFGGIINLNPILATLFALFWITFLTNIVNWSKGFDGQLPGIAVIAALAIALLGFRFSADITQWSVVILASITAGAYLGFLPFNFYPQKIMPGYGGGALAGFLLAILAILSTTKVGTAIVVLGVPLVDATYSIIRRLLQGRSPVWGDRGHLHHKILDEWHWGKRRAALFYWGITALLGTLALSLNSQQKFYTMAMLTIIIGGLLLWFKFFSTSLKAPDRAKHSKTSLS
jgi:UDP-GlcNAc:undecaprenyl-phosphate GlcNAc-1-phosphate transferase